MFVTFYYTGNNLDQIENGQQRWSLLRWICLDVVMSLENTPLPLL